MALLASHSVNFGSEIMPFLGENSGLFVAGMIIAAVVALVVYYRRSIIGHGGSDPDADGVKPRFRKRDKVIFYGKKMLRKVKQFSAVPREDGYRSRIRKRQKVMLNFAKQLLHFQENEPERQLKEPPPAFFEADWADSEGIEPHLPTEVVYMLKSVKVFGYFERPLFFELCKYIETKFIPANTPLIRTGQIDESIYVVQSGKLNVYLQEKDGSELLVKEASTGDSVYSVLSILDVLAGRKPARLMVTARAVVDSHVLKLPAKAFQIVFEQYPDSLVRVVQIIMLRLQQVSFMALHDFLGLSSELLNPGTSGGSTLRSLSVHSLPDNIGRQTVAEATPKVSLDLDDRDRGGVAAGGPMPGSGDKIGDSPERESSEAIDIDARPSEAVPKRHKKLNRSVSFSSAVLCVQDSADQSGASQTVPVPLKRSHSLGVIRQPSSDAEDGLTDFEIACGRARVNQGETSPRKGKWELGGSSSPQASPSSVDMRFDFPYRSPSSKLIEARRQSSFGPADPDDEEIMLNAATKDIAELLELHDEQMLDEMLTLAKIPADTVLVKQGEQECSLYFVVTGSLHVSQKNMNDEHDHFLFQAKPGEFVGVLSVLTGEPSFFTIKALNTCHLVILSKASVYSLMKEQPKTVLNIAECIIQRLSPFVRRIDFALDWMHVEAGRAVYRQSEQADCVYIVLNGRLRSIVTSDSGKKTLVGEYGRGELVGVVEVMTQTSRAATVHAVRDTELAKLPEGLLNTIKQQFPQVVLRLIRLLGERILGHYKRGHIPSSEPSVAKPTGVDNQQLGSNLGTIAFIPASEDVPLINFTFELCMAFNAIGPALLLTSELVQSKLGSSALDSMHEYRLATWLGQQEDLHRIVLYQADNYMSAWTKRCIRQADCIIIVARSDQEPAVGQLEMQLENMQVRAHKELVLLHRFDLNHPLRISHTIDWLNARGWISTHHHIRCPRKIFSRKSLVERYAKDPDGYDFPERNSDFARLARRLTGTSIGLVLGGGGARGLSHVGVIKALEEAGIPIDMVGGTSIGALVGAVYAEDADVVRLTRRVKEWSVHDMASLFKTVLDLTYPFTSMFSGYGFNASIRSALGEQQIEDLLLPYFTITTDITSSKMRIHRDGSLWRYVRSSMSLSGYLPPLCDPKDGHLLLDGGYVNNLPADVMKSMMGAQSIIAIDVGSEYSDTLTNYGDHLSGWWLLWKKWNPFAEPVKVPDMAEIQTRLAYVSCMKQLEEVKESTYCEYIRPPIDRYKTLDFGRFDEIMEVGYKHGKALFQSWSKKTSIISSVLNDWQPGQNRGPQLYAEPPKATGSLISPSFSNLARIISQMEPHSSSSFTSELSRRPARHTVSDTMLYEEDEEDDGQVIMQRMRSGSLDGDNRGSNVLGHGPDTSEDEAGYVSEGSLQLRRRRIEIQEVTMSM